MSFNSQLRAGGSNKAGEMGEGPQTPVCVKWERSAGIKTVSFMGRTRYLIASRHGRKALMCREPRPMENRCRFWVSRYRMVRKSPVS